jgi:hypothetical protein
VFTAFSPEDESIVSCPDSTSLHALEFSWSSTGATEAWFSTGTDDAAANPDAQVDPSGSYSDATFDCSRSSQIYTVTLDNGAGDLTSHTITIEGVLSSN